MCISGCSAYIRNWAPWVRTVFSKHGIRPVALTKGFNPDIVWSHFLTIPARLVLFFLSQTPSLHTLQQLRIIFISSLQDWWPLRICYVLRARADVILAALNLGTDSWTWFEGLVKQLVYSRYLAKAQQRHSLLPLMIMIRPYLKLFAQERNEVIHQKCKKATQRGNELNLRSMRLQASKELTQLVARSWDVWRPVMNAFLKRSMTYAWMQLKRYAVLSFYL